MRQAYLMLKLNKTFSKCTLVLLVFFIISSCGNNKSETTNKQNSDSATMTSDTAGNSQLMAAGVKTMECLYLTMAQVNAYIAAPIGDKEIIFQFRSTTMTANSPEIKVCSYLANTHAHHGVGSAKTNLSSFNPAQGCYTFLNNTEYILGNNYLTARKLKNYIDNLSNPVNYILKFTPNVDASGHIYFTFNAIDLTTLQPLATKKPVALGANDTNPSPPAPPDA